ncbi:hypothetical protein [Hymenobacter sp. BRD67]|uniref:hypothetical protein n=1 Tax=Hymenobacter sp. BRD67 TaxID=2675877 RepID=UPI00156302AF|nr:hypothetical protein [Hymenobacter sp. BRD67]QKG51925.1 hypothetical protein GKZ67_03975 [Hymenobacter sp. BRD67]
MLPSLPPDSLLLSYPGYGFFAWPTTDQTPAKGALAVSQLGRSPRPRLEARAEELTRDLAGWSVPPATMADANKLGAHWLW